MKTTDIITQILLSLASILTPVVVGYIAVFIQKAIPKRTELVAIEQLAKDAVVITEQTAIGRAIGSKKQYAILELRNMLDHLGFSRVDEELLSAAIEHAYCELKDQLHSVYGAQEIQGASK